jgi:hypothetical protein
MGGGNHAKAGAVQYAHAVPPSWNAGTMFELEQRAYFSAWSMVLDVPSVISARRVLPCGLIVVMVVVVKSFSADTRALGP